MDGKTETRTTLHLSVTREDKRELKIIAAERDTTISTSGSSASGGSAERRQVRTIRVRRRRVDAGSKE